MAAIDNISTVLVTLFTVLFSAGAWKFYETKMKLKAKDAQDEKNDQNMFRDDLRERVSSASLKQLENDDLKVISLIPNIMGMMGDRMPMLLKDTDVRRILKDDTLEEHIESKKLKFDTGESIIVCEGPFKEFSGIIKEVKGDRVDVEIKIFGRNTAVSLTLDQIQKP